MGQDLEHYGRFYADKLWNLVPPVYQAADSQTAGVDGPLRELVNRIGGQAAVLRRNIDRLWEDQSIETCDDWVIPYIGDLLATNLVASLDARGRRLDVASTIYYRRRAGTVGILEEIAHDITGWDSRVVEFFRRLARTRHGLDPDVGMPAATDDPPGYAALQSAEGLAGANSRSQIGGYADLRNRYAASKTGSAFDEFFHTADFRRGRGRTGWYDIPNLGVFLWRLKSFGVVEATPVASSTTGLYAFDPTGRALPLFGRSARTRVTAYGDRWVSPEEWQMPGPLRKPLYDAQQSNLYPDSLQVFRQAGAVYDPVKAADIAVYPDCGMFRVATALENDVLAVSYHYGFSSNSGAGPYDRRMLHQAMPQGANPTTTVSGGGAIPALPAKGTLLIADSMTYTAANASGIVDLTVRSTNKQRPLLSLSHWVPWKLTGAVGSNLLGIDGIFVSGGDVVIAGDFDTVSLTCCTLDPGGSGAGLSPATVLATSVAGQPLWPSRLWIEANLRLLRIDRCLLGPIRTRNKGDVETIEILDSIVQGIRTQDFGDFTDLKDPARLLQRLHAQNEPLSAYVWGQLTQGTQQAIDSYLAPAANPPSLDQVAQAMMADINAKVLGSGTSIYTSARFALVDLDPAIQAVAKAPPPGMNLVQLNRELLEAAYPTELADLALGITTGVAALERCTILGPAYLHRFEASECILDDRVQVEDAQHGCVRFSAWATGSTLPRRYESVEIAPKAPVFTSVDFGQPGYAQLLTNADRAIVAGGQRPSITEGGPNGSEMGAFAREMNAIKQRSLLIKYQEFMPLGLNPVVVNVT
jgi:hypothetical protein